MIHFARDYHIGNAKGSLDTAAIMLPNILRMVRLFMSVEYGDENMKDLYDKIRDSYENSLKMAMGSLKDGYLRFAKEYKSLTMSDPNFIEKQLKLMTQYIDMINGPYDTRIVFAQSFIQLFKDNDKKLLAFIKERKKEKYRLTELLAPFLAMALAERLTMCVYIDECPSESIDEFLQRFSATLRNMAAQSKTVYFL